MADIRVEHGRDELGYIRPGLLIAYVDDRVVAVASMATGTRVWVAHRHDRPRRHTYRLTEVAVRELLLQWAAEAAS